jgi:hypothetical protein
VNHKSARDKKGGSINLHQQLLAQSPIRVAFILRFLEEYGIVANFNPLAKGAKARAHRRVAGSVAVGSKRYPHPEDIRFVQKSYCLRERHANRMSVR